MEEKSYETSQQYSSDFTIESSLQRLNGIQTSSSQRVSEARVKTDQREAKRRDVEEEDNAKRMELIKRVGNVPQEQNDEVVGWEQCKKATNAQDISKLLDRQHLVCEAAVGKLEDISNQLGLELREKDHEYITALKRNRHEVEQMQQLITNEHQKLKAAFERELQLIEQSLTADKNQILNTNKDELESLVEQHQEAEIQSLERQHQSIEKHRHEIKQSEAKGELQREVLKHKLEAEIRALEIELEDTKAKHQFDTEKLEYDVRVLNELSPNEQSAKQKQRINKGKEELSRALEHKQRAKAKGVRQNELLENDCERIEKQASGLRDKFERFKISDDEKYKAVLSMHSKDLQKLQGELKQTQDFIFGGGVSAESLTSDVTWHGGSGGSETVKSNKTNECKVDDDETAPIVDEFGIDLKNSNHHNFGKHDEWNQAETLMTNYRRILERREDLNTEVALVEKENLQLDNELQAKLAEDINDELKFPPTKNPTIIEVGGGDAK